MSTVNPTGRDIRVASQEGAEGRPSLNLYHNNRSVPHLPSQNQSLGEEEEDSVPPMPYFDPTVALDSFSALHVSEPAHNRDPIPRAASAMSTQSHRLIQPRHATTLPPQYEPSDPASRHSYSAPDPVYDTVYGGDPAAAYSYDDHIQSPASYDPQQHPHHQYQNWQHQQPPPQAAGFNPLYAAASNVLGMGPPPAAQQLPPPGPPAQMHMHMPHNGYPAAHPGYAASELSISSSHSAPYPSSLSTYSSTAPTENDTEFEGRPSFSRGETSTSVHPASVKSKAVDLSAPPYTKQYIDQYRQRIKADPDPEAHFLYAKYLIDAARKIRSTSKDQRSAKKYSELLITEALKVIRRVATQGETYSEAQFFLANCHGTGALGLQVDHERAYHLYLQAAKQNHAAACYRVAVCNEIGAGTRREPPRAAAFYRKAASLGDTAAMYKLGMILLNGTLGEPKNPREAVGWLRRAAEQADEENPHALHELALLHESPSNQIVQYDPALAKNLYTQAAHLGYTQSQYKLGQCYEYGNLTCPVDPRRSIAWYTKAAEKGDAEAELALSGWYLTGSEGVLKQSDSEAYLWARRAANRGLSKAEYAVGYYAEVGIGIKQDLEFAKRWYMRAAAQGNKRAMNRLTELKRQGGKRTNMARPTRQQAKDECVIC